MIQNRLCAEAKEEKMTEIPAAEGPYFDELSVGQVFDTAPGLTLRSGHVAQHQAIVGDRLRLALDAHLARKVTGSELASPALVWDVSIGQSTLVTHHVKANLFYRGLAFRRFPALGDTLYTSTEVVALRQNRPRPGRAATGLAALRITTVDQEDRPVLDFWRCAMMPLRDPEAQTGHDADLSAVGPAPGTEKFRDAVRDWRLDAFRAVDRSPGFDALAEGRTVQVVGGDTVSGAPELARLILNIAEVHHDPRTTGPEGRLVYGGHTIGLALSQATRAFPGLVTVAGWHGCDHTGPVYEGDTVTSRVTVERLESLPDGGGLAHLRSEVEAVTGQGASRPVLDWRYAALFA